MQCEHAFNGPMTKGLFTLDAHWKQIQCALKVDSMRIVASVNWVCIVESANLMRIQCTLSDFTLQKHNPLIRKTIHLFCHGYADM